MFFFSIAKAQEQRTERGHGEVRWDTHRLMTNDPKPRSDIASDERIREKHKK